ncbi:MAG: inositol monophosphatase [Pseudobdellovibrionaceae bacterium]
MAAYPKTITTSLGRVSVDSIEHAIRETAQKLIVPRYRQLGASDIENKGDPTDFVTVADREAEMALREYLTKLLPGSLFVGEESLSLGLETIDPLLHQSKPVWVLDPIDGTSHFVKGIPGFATMLALVDNGETLAGWIYDPLDEGMNAGFKKHGTFRNGRKMVAPTPSKETYGLVASYYVPDATMQAVKALQTSIRHDFSNKVSAIYYLDFLQDGPDFYICFQANPWDQLPGVGLLEPLGFVAVTHEGKSYTRHCESGQKGYVIARNRDIIERVMDEIISPLRDTLGEAFWDRKETK